MNTTNRNTDAFGAPSALIFADCEARRRTMADAVTGAGVRIAAAMPLANAAARLVDQAWIDIVLLDADEETEGLEALLDQVQAAAVAGRHGAVLQIAPALIDFAAARAGHADVLLLCDADDAERDAAIAALLAGRTARLHDVSTDRVMPRLQQLSAEVNRIARTLATLSHVDAERVHLPLTPEKAPAESIDAGDDRAQAALLRMMIRARRLREQFFEGELFADPAWDMLLDLMLARLEGRQVAVSSLCIAAAVPPTTALRWIKLLTDQGLFARIADPRDGRRVFIELSDAVADGMTGYLRAMQRLSATG